MLKFENIRYWFACHLFGDCPDNDELDDKTVKDLSEKLDDSSPSDTVINILDWQDKNLIYWAERQLISMLKLFIASILVLTSIFFGGIYLINIRLFILYSDPFFH
jgi:hypothetical protein